METLETFGVNPGLYTEQVAALGATCGTLGRVTAVHRERYDVVTEYGTLQARLKSGVYFGPGGAATGMNFPTVGDVVTIQVVPDGDSLITSTLERKSYFSRRDPDKGRGEQAVAANFDYCLIVASLNQDFNLRRIERYLAQTWDSGAVPVVVLTKADLVTEPEKQVAAVEAIANFAEVIAVSTVTGAGLDRLEQYLQPGKTLVLLGSSGVGKSTLVNALAGSEMMTTAEIREDDAKGRHTTTHRQLLQLPNGALVIDTPGMRELGMWDAGTGLSSTFTDVEQVLDQGCRFSDCNHTGEPGCAVTAAIDSGELDQARWDNYLKLQKEILYAEDRIAYDRAKAQHWRTFEKEYRAATREKLVKPIRT